MSTYELPRAESGGVEMTDKKPTRDSMVRPHIRDDGAIVLDRTKPFDGKCADCGAVEDLRPYGKDGAWVCFTCAMKDEEEAERQFMGMMEELK